MLVTHPALKVLVPVPVSVIISLGAVIAQTVGNVDASAYFRGKRAGKGAGASEGAVSGAGASAC